MNRTHLLIAGTHILAVGIGIIVGQQITEEKAFRKYEEASASMRRAFELARTPSEAPAATEQELDVTSKPLKIIDSGELHSLSLDEEPNVFGGTIEIVPGADYHKAVAAKETPVDLFVAGGVNDYGVSYIEEEDFEEEDGRTKNHMTIVMDEHNPLFFLGGQQIHDWDERVGDSILVDFFKLVPANSPNPVLYVRNHKTDEDYEVSREMP